MLKFFDLLIFGYVLGRPIWSYQCITTKGGENEKNEPECFI